MQKIFHIADTHLDAPLSNLPLEIRGQIESSQGAFLNGLVNLCNEREAILVIAGDFFDTPNPKERTLQMVEEAFRQLEQPVVALPGNHDPYFPGGIWERLEERAGVFVMREGQEHIQIGNLHFYGKGYGAFNEVSPAISTPVGDGIHILLWHGDVGTGDGGYHTLTGDVWKKFDYVALGHIHKAVDVQGLSYPGFSRSRGFDETGAGAGHFVTFDFGTQVEKVQLPGIQFSRTVVDVQGIETSEELEEKLLEILPEDKGLLRLYITGRRRESLLIEKGVLQMKILQCGFSFVQIFDDTKEEYNIAREIEKVGFSGALARAIQNHADDPFIDRAVEILLRAQQKEALQYED